MRPARSQCGLESLGCQEEYRWDRGARYILHLFRRSVVGPGPAWWGPRYWLFVCAPKQTVCLTYFFIGRLWVSGLCGLILHVIVQD